VREIELEGKVYLSTRNTIDALAWATNRRGRNTWTHKSNVVPVIAKYLADHRVQIGTENFSVSNINGRIRTTIWRLVQEGFAEITRANGTTGSYTSFRFKDDVNLNGHSPVFLPEGPDTRPTYRKGSDSPTHKIPNTAGRDLAERGLNVSDVAIDLDVPLPPGPKPVRYHESEVNDALDKWAANNPEAYAEWADSVVERLGALYG
jgi:hypothetical protein